MSDFDSVTLIRGKAAELGTDRPLSTLPPDLIDRIPRGLQLLGALFFVAFAFDPLFFLFTKAVGATSDYPLPPQSPTTAVLRALDGAAALASATLWWMGRRRSLRPRTLHLVGLAYAVLICLEISIVTHWQFFLDHGALPGLTWVPVVVIAFPLVLPGPPRRMTAAAALAAAMSPLGLWMLDATHRIDADVDAYLSAIVASVFAVVFAAMGSRLIYGLGRQVTAARELGSYRLEDRLGSGGMGEVWRASHRMLARPAAIKLIRPELVGTDPRHSDEARARFEREAQAIARLHSPHTVEIYDYGVTDRGVFYYAMELLDGLDAERLVADFGPLPSERVVHILLQMCHSLSEAHGRGLVHRDVKPANVVLCRYGDDIDFVKVLDFGLVTALRGTPGSDPHLTGEHTIGGTPSYIAPEQALGLDVDGRADLYATGCVAYWLLTGKRVFTGGTAAEILVQHASEPAVAPSVRTEIDIPAALDAVVLACLAKDPSERPGSARALADRLAAIQLRSSWTPKRAREWWDLHRPESDGRGGGSAAPPARENAGLAPA